MPIGTRHKYRIGLVDLAKVLKSTCPVVRHTRCLSIILTNFSTVDYRMGINHLSPDFLKSKSESVVRRTFFYFVLVSTGNDGDLYLMVDHRRINLLTNWQNIIEFSRRYSQVFGQ